MGLVTLKKVEVQDFCRTLFHWRFCIVWLEYTLDDVTFELEYDGYGVGNKQLRLLLSYVMTYFRQC